MKKYDFVEVTVGNLPEWYNEAEHDHSLEGAIERNWQEQAGEVRVTYQYSGDSFVRAWNYDGDLVMNREHDLGYAFNQINH